MKIYNYNTIYQNYNSNLLNQLRSFGDDEELSLWVPDEDISKSVVNLVISTNFSKLKIKFESAAYNLLKQLYIKNSLKSYGVTNFVDSDFSIVFLREYYSNKKILLTISKKRTFKKKYSYKKTIFSKKKLPLIHASYLQNLKYKTKKINKESKKSKNISSLVALSFKDNKCYLQIFVNPVNHFIIDGDCQSKNNTIMLFGRYLLSNLISIPINEARDHALIKIEYNLRPQKIKKHTGIILRDAGGSIFSYFQFILKQMFNDYEKKTGSKLGINFFKYKVPDNWKSLTKKNQIDKIKYYINIFNKNNLSDNMFLFDELKNDNKLFIKSRYKALANSYNHLFFKLENFLFDVLNVKFEVYYHDRKDENALRSL